MDTLAQKVTDTVRNWILSGELEKGGRIEEVPLAERLRVSRTPVRAALATLANEGLIEHLPKRGYLVRTFSAQEIMPTYEVRAVLEGLVCRNVALIGLDAAAQQQLQECLAVGDRILAKGRLLEEDLEPYRQMNVTFHNTLIQSARNSVAERFAIQAQALAFSSDRIMLWHDHAIIVRSHDDHHRILQAILERDCSRAEQLMREHVYYAGVILRDNYEKTAGAIQALALAETPREARKPG
jgi:GntR family transcriptional regulator of vanillate catabolism